MRVGLTGGIASGKSTVAQLLVELGAVLKAERNRKRAGSTSETLRGITAAEGFNLAVGAINRAQGGRRHRVVGGHGAGRGERKTRQKRR